MHLDSVMLTNIFDLNKISSFRCYCYIVLTLGVVGGKKVKKFWGRNKNAFARYYKN